MFKGWWLLLPLTPPGAALIVAFAGWLFWG